MSKKNKQKDNRKSAARKNNNLNKKDVFEKQENVQTKEPEEKATSLIEDMAAKFDVNASSITLIVYGIMFLFIGWAGNMALQNPLDPTVPEITVKALEVFLDLTHIMSGFTLSLGILSIIDKKKKDRKEKGKNNEPN